DGNSSTPSTVSPLAPFQDTTETVGSFQATVCGLRSVSLRGSPPPSSRKSSGKCVASPLSTTRRTPAASQLNAETTDSLPAQASGLFASNEYSARETCAFSSISQHNRVGVRHCSGEP